MDRKIERKTRLPKIGKRLAVWAVPLLTVALLGSYWQSAPRGESLSIDPQKLTISDIRQGQFQEFLPLRGTVLPERVIYLDAIGGGRVETLFVEEGEQVKAGDKILELSNTNLQLSVLAREADVSEQINNLRNTRLAMEQSRLAKKSELIDIDYKLTVLERQEKKRRRLLAGKLIARDDYQQVRDELDYLRKRRQVVEESQAQELALQQAQITQLEANVKTLQNNLGISRKSLDNLVIRAPVDGQLTFLTAELGESMASGQRLGQIDVLDSFKITTRVDEFYLSRVEAGQRGRFQVEGRPHELRVAKVYPGVTNGQFEVDWQFVGEPPADIRRGQTLQIRLMMSDNAPALVVDQGGFYQDTGGNWVFVIDADGQGASKRAVTLGKRNAELVEVLGGLSEGERIITSSYGEFATMDRLVF